MRAAFLWCLCLALGGCYAGAGTERPAVGTSLFPPGVMSPAGDVSHTLSGIFPGSIPEDPYCCWIGPRASFQTYVPARARTLIVTLFVPELGPIHDAVQGVTIAVDTAPVKHVERLPVGTSVIGVGLEPRDRPHIAEVVLTAQSTFSPKAYNISADSRDLAFYLKSVRTR